MATNRLGGLRRLRELARGPALDDEGEQELIGGLVSSAGTWRLEAFYGLWRHGSSTAGVFAERLLELGQERDPFFCALLDLAQAQIGGGDLDALSRRALGRGGGLHEMLWPRRPAVGRRQGEGWDLRRLATQALAFVPGGAPVLTEVLKRDPDWAVREAAARALGEHDRGIAATAVLECARDDPWLPVRVAAAETLNVAPDLASDERFAWRVPGSEPYFRYLTGPARGDYRDELTRATRNGRGLCWEPFGVYVDHDLGEEPPEDLDPDCPLVRRTGAPWALSLGRDLVHHPEVAWSEELLWPVCCGDYAILHGHDPQSVVSPELDCESWFLESLAADLPLPASSLDELEAETHAFRCGRCGRWTTLYEPSF